MKKRLIVIIILSFFFFHETKQVSAFHNLIENEDITTEEKIKILQEEITRLWSIILQLQSQEKIKENINAHSYLVKNLSDNSIILEKNSRYFYPIASITKLMNAVIVLENIDLNKTITITPEMLEPHGHSPCIFEGLTVSANNLLKASLIQSTNDAAEALSYFIGKEKFIKMMNEKAKDLEMESTLFYDPHGLSLLNSSTASDIYKLIDYVYKNHPELLEITKDNDFYLPDPSGRILKFKNLNNFHESSNFIGGKTGYLPAARQTFVSIFKIKNNPIAIILLKSNNRQSDVSKIIDWLELSN